jgi:hypothetical protein
MSYELLQWGLFLLLEQEGMRIWYFCILFVPRRLPESFLKGIIVSGSARSVKFREKIIVVDVHESQTPLLDFGSARG